MLGQKAWVSGMILLLGVSPAWAVPLAGTIPLNSLGTGGARVRGFDAFDEAGFSVASAGDFNGDGVDDWLVGAPNASPLSRGEAGEAFLVYGQFGAAAVSGSVELSDVGLSVSGIRFQGGLADERTGYSVHSAGDVNGDGIGDILIGARRSDVGDDREGRTYLVYGQSGGAALAGEIDLSQVGSTIAGAVFEGAVRRDQSGSAVATAGDVNGDGLDDLLIGAPAADPNGSGSGTAYLVYGQAGGSELSGSIALSAVGSSVAGAQLEGVASGDSAGIHVASAGDFNADGLADVLVGANFADPTAGVSAGVSYLLYGQDGAGTLSGTLQLSDVGGAIAGVRFDGATQNDRSGSSLGAAGDVNGDGVGDVVIGSPSDTGPPAGLGRAQLIYGKSGAGQLSGALDLANVGGAIDGAVFAGVAGDLAGASVAQVGDVDGDGIDDFLVGEPLADGAEVEVGKAYLVYGQPGVTSLTGNLNLSDVGGAIRGAVFLGIEQKDHTGESVAGAGDINGDGLADLILGAPDAAPDGASSGEAYIVYGRRGSAVRWIGADGAWDDAFQWLGFEGPSVGDQVTIAPSSPATIAGPAADTSVDLLLLAGSTLQLDPGIRLDVATGLTIQADGALAGGSAVNPAVVVGDLVNAGLMSPGGSVGSIEVTGNYEQTGVLQIEVDSATSFDQLFVGQTATLGGDLEIVFNYLPTETTDYQFLVAGDIAGSATFRVAGMVDVSDVSVDFASGTFRFTASNVGSAVPEPASLTALAGLLAVALNRRRRRTSGTGR